MTSWVSLGYRVLGLQRTFLGTALVSASDCGGGEVVLYFITRLETRLIWVTLYFHRLSAVSEFNGVLYDYIDLNDATEWFWC